MAHTSIRPLAGLIILSCACKCIQYFVSVQCASLSVFASSWSIARRLLTVGNADSTVTKLHLLGYLGVLCLEWIA